MFFWGWKFRFFLLDRYQAQPAQPPAATRDLRSQYPLWVPEVGGIFWYSISVPDPDSFVRAAEVEPTSAKAKDKEKAKAVGVEVISNIEI